MTEYSIICRSFNIEKGIWIISLANYLGVESLPGSCPQPLAKGKVNDILIFCFYYQLICETCLIATYWRDLFILIVDYVS